MFESKYKREDDLMLLALVAFIERVPSRAHRLIWFLIGLALMLMGCVDPDMRPYKMPGCKYPIVGTFAVEFDNYLECREGVRKPH